MRYGSEMAKAVVLLLLFGSVGASYWNGEFITGEATIQTLRIGDIENYSCFLLLQIHFVCTCHAIR